MRCSRGQLEEFFTESKIWKDIVDEIDSWIYDNHMILEDEKNDFKFGDFKRHGGICEALRKVRHIGDYMLLDEELKLKEEKQDGKA
jgi:hypothetical protein